MSASAPEHLLALGDVVRDTYTVEAVLGSGAFSTVYRVRHRFLGPQAMKVFRRSAVSTNDDLLQEARLLATLVDPAIVRVFEANSLCIDGEERSYMTMELVVGGSLEAFLERKLRLHPLSALKTAAQICAGLGVAHRLHPPIVHRDVKPQNVLVWSVSVHGTPQVKIGDFGLARHVDPVTLMARAAGTVLYLAPEAVWDFHTPASDVYSIGVVLFRMLTGVFPFPIPSEEQGMTVGEVRNAVVQARQGPAPAPSRFRLGLPSPVDGVVTRALATDPQARFADAIELGQQIRRVIAELWPE